MPVFTNILSGGIDAELLGKLIGQFDNTDALPPAQNYPNGTLAYVVGDKFYKAQGNSWLDGTDIVGGGSGGGSGDMLKSAYDTNDDGTVDAADTAAGLSSGSNAATAAEVRTHLDSSSNPHGVTAAQVGASEDSHTHDETDIDSGGATSGQVLTADGSGGADWEDATGGGSSGLQLQEGGSSTLEDLTQVLSPEGDESLYMVRSSLTDRSTTVEGVASFLERANTSSLWADVSGAVNMDLNEGRVFRFRMEGDTTLSFSGAAISATSRSPSWTLILGQDSTGGHTLTPPTVQWIDGASWDDLDDSANAVNIIQFWDAYVTQDPYAALLWNGAVMLDPYVFSFQQNGTIKIVMTRAEDLDVANASTHGDGSVTYAKNGSDISTRTSFDASDVLEVTVSGQTSDTAVSIPRYAV